MVNTRSKTKVVKQGRNEKRVVHVKKRYQRRKTLDKISDKIVMASEATTHMCIAQAVIRDLMGNAEEDVALDVKMHGDLLLGGERSPHQPLEAVTPTFTTQHMKEASIIENGKEQAVAMVEKMGTALDVDGLQTEHGSSLHIAQTESLNLTLSEERHLIEEAVDEVTSDHGLSRSFCANGLECTRQEGRKNTLQKSNSDRECALEKTRDPPEVAVFSNFVAADTVLDLVVTNKDIVSSRRDVYAASDDINNGIYDEASGKDLGYSRQQQCKSLNVTEIADAQGVDDDDFSEIDSLASNFISMRGYRVKPEYASVLTSIISKQGDIGSKCSLCSVSHRSFCMEQICDIFQKLKDAEIKDITESEIKNMLASISDIERSVIEVGWLKERLNEIYEAKKAIPLLKSDSNLKKQHAERKERIRNLKKQLEAYKNHYAIFQAKALEIQNKISSAKSELSAAEAEAQESEKIISEHKSRLKNVWQLEKCLAVRTVGSRFGIKLIIFLRESLEELVLTWVTKYYAGSFLSIPTSLAEL